MPPDDQVPELVRGKKELARWLGLTPGATAILLRERAEIAPRGWHGVRTEYPRSLVMELRRIVREEQESRKSIVITGVIPLARLLGLRLHDTKQLLEKTLGHGPRTPLRLTQPQVDELQRLSADLPRPNKRTPRKRMACAANNRRLADPHPGKQRQERQERRCMCCKRTFLSWGIGNRLCDRCKRDTEWL